MGLLKKMESVKPRSAVDSFEEVVETNIDPYIAAKKKIHNGIIDRINSMGRPDVDRETMQHFIDEAVNDEANMVPRVDRPKVAQEIFNDIMGLGPLEELLANPEYSEIMVNGPKHIYVERSGKLELTGLTFNDDAHVINVIDRIVSQIGRHIDESSPMVDARLLDGSRVNAVIPPVSLVGPVLTIRKFGKKPITAKKLIEFGSCNSKMMAFMEAAVKGKLNIIVAGGTGSGKTTLLNVLSSFIPEDERIVTIEDAAELQLVQEHLITLESRPSNLEGKGAITIRSLVKNALRMRPDRIIVGEVRSEETMDMLQAMNTGHDGSLTTTHANSPRDTLARLETMVLMSGMELPMRAIRDQVASAIDLIIQQSRFRDGSRKITSITEITGMEEDVVSMQDLFVYETEGKLDSAGRFIGRFRATGVRPYCIDKIKQNGVAVSNDWFSN